MGAESFVHHVKAISAEEGFRILIAEADREYGDRSYNGSINTCSMGRCKKRYDKHNDTNKKDAYKYIDSVDNGDKWTADYIDLGTLEYQVLTIKKQNLDVKTPVIRVRHVVREQDMRGKGRFLKDFDTKKEADDYAVALAVKNNKPYDIFKEGVLVSGDDKISTVVIEKKSYKSKPTLKSMPNRKIVELHEYIFFGWASC